MVAQFRGVHARPHRCGRRHLLGPSRPVRLHQLGVGLPEAAGTAAHHFESTPLRNPFWQYSRDKIACEDLLVAAYREAGFPATIVRPSHTYDKTLIPTTGGWTDVARMRAGKPVVVHGDGTSLWTLTHSDDFAVAFVGLLGHPAAIGDSFTITSDEYLPWNTIYQLLRRRCRGTASAAGPHRLGDHRGCGTGARSTAAGRPLALGDLRQQQGQGAGPGVRLHHALRHRRARQVVVLIVAELASDSFRP